MGQPKSLQQQLLPLPQGQPLPPPAELQEHGSLPLPVAHPHDDTHVLTFGPLNDRPATREQPAAVTGCRCLQQQAREGTSMRGQQALDEKTNEQILQGAAGGRKGRNHEEKKKK